MDRNDINKNGESLGTVCRFPRRFRPFLLPGESLRRRDGVVCEFRGKDRVGCGSEGEAVDQKARGASDESGQSPPG
jgi:hypothetical protein